MIAIEEAAPDTTQPRVPLRTVLLSIGALWLCYYVLMTLRSLMGLDYQIELFVGRALVIASGVGVTILLWLVLRAFDTRALWLRIVVGLVAALPAALLVAQVNRTVFAELEQRMMADMGERQGVVFRRDEQGNIFVDMKAEGEDAQILHREVLLSRPNSHLMQLADIALGPYFLLLAWAALYYALVSKEQARMAERREGEYRRAAKAAELRSLRYQLNPHFLFNTFNSLSALVVTGKADRAETMIQQISRFYRHSLADDPSADLSLADEFDLQRLYLDIEAVRFPERLRTVFDLPGELADAQVPGMILQPLVENSVRYAVAATSRAVTITLAAREEYGRLVITVSDNGPGGGMETDGGHGIGLANVRQRLAARYGDQASLVSGPVSGGYSSIIRLPIES
jgi:signal transduction histidine kinase